GVRVLVTRAQPGELALLLAAEGATVVHVPLIAIEPPADGGAELQARLAELDTFDWLVVTSPAGAERVVEAAATVPNLRLGAVGTATARVVRDATGRDVLTPTHQLAAALGDDLVAAAGAPPQRFLLALAEQASDVIETTLRAAGHDVVRCTAYRTVRQPADPAVLERGDALLLASGSAVRSWVDSVGLAAPPLVVAIGPTTASVANDLGLKLSAVAADHSLPGLIEALCTAVAETATIKRADTGSVD
ncbi:MAG: uroporphyrinogen-III synthase, partial [Actinomycetota bacterium]